MVHVAVLFTHGFAEIEAFSIVDILRRADITTHIIGTEPGPIIGARMITTSPDFILDDISTDTIDALVLPGGSPGYINLRTNEQVISLIKDMMKQKKIISAICASPAVLSDAGILKGKQCTIYPGMEDELIKGGGIYSADIVVIDDNIITSKGPATTIPFTLTLVECLTDKKTANTVRKQLLTDMVFR
ncbi:MAG: DJ-1/PfpI family protein [Candidatus Thermoplasmatota archaeon]|nr:DJ-1/PfpI family protein [Candidatus Thermoplasmatota archaeon]